MSLWTRDADGHESAEVGPLVLAVWPDNGGYRWVVEHNGRDLDNGAETHRVFARKAAIAFARWWAQRQRDEVFTATEGHEDGGTEDAD